MDKRKEALSRVNKYIRFYRYNQLTLEQLKRLQKIKNSYDRKKSSVEKLTFKVESIEQLSKKLVLPLKVKGVFLTEGRPLAKFYRKEDLEMSVKNELNKSFPLMLDHRDAETSMIVGKVDKIKYDPTIKGLRWWGHINDESFARNVLDGTITDVSATIMSVTEQDEELGMVGVDLIFKELSLVMRGAEPNNSIEVDG